MKNTALQYLEHAQSENVTPPNPNMVTLVTDSNNKEPVSDKHTFQVGVSMKKI